MITGLGYTVAVVEPAKAATADPLLGKPVPSPRDAPASFAAALQRARESSRPVLIDFWAPWCAPCRRLKEVTLANAQVEKALASIEVIMVDLDKEPQLAEAFGVKSIPDVFFVDREGIVVDRLQKFELPAAFLERLGKLTHPSQPRSK